MYKKDETTADKSLEFPAFNLITQLYLLLILLSTDKSKIKAGLSYYFTEYSHTCDQMR
eukprot:Pgem_evm1s353